MLAYQRLPAIAWRQRFASKPREPGGLRPWFRAKWTFHVQFRSAFIVLFAGKGLPKSGKLAL